MIFIEYLQKSYLTGKAFVACFQEEEDLVNAHRKQVEDTMNIVREVCDLVNSPFELDYYLD